MSKYSDSNSFINFSLNFEIQKLELDNSNFHKNKFSLNSKNLTLSNISLTLPRLISSNFFFTFLILTDGSLLLLPYTLPSKSITKNIKKNLFSYSFSRGDFLSLKH